MIVSHAPTSMNCLILFLYYYLYFISHLVLIWN